MGKQWTKREQKAVDDHDVPMRRISSDDLKEAEAMADGLNIVEPVGVTQETEVMVGDAKVLSRDLFAQIQAEHDAAVAFKLSHGGGSIDD